MCFVCLISVCIPAGYYIAFKNIPMFPSVCTNPALGDRSLFKTLIRVHPPYNKLAKAVRQIFRGYNWKRFSVFSREVFLCSYGAQGLYDLFKGTDVVLTDWVKAPDTISDGTIEQVLTRMRTRARSKYILSKLANILFSSSVTRGAQGLFSH